MARFPSTERLLEVISSPEAEGDGATVEQLHMALRVPLGDEALAAALEQVRGIETRDAPSINPPIELAWLEVAASVQTRPRDR